MSIREAAPANTIGIPRTSFNKQAFDAQIWNFGYDVIFRRAIQCPCKGEGSTNLSTCQNCLGLGWVFINPLQTKAILTSINTNTKYKYWSPEFKGTIAATLRDIERVSFMDQIVLKDKVSLMSEVRPTRQTGNQKFIFTSYPVKRVNSMFLFGGSSEPLILIPKEDYSISPDNPYVIKLSSLIQLPVGFNGSVSLEYEHNMQYNVVDIPHDIRSSTIINTNGKNESQDLPIQAICQKSHYLTGDSPKYDGSGVQDNSYL